MKFASKCREVDLNLVRLGFVSCENYARTNYTSATAIYTKIIFSSLPMIIKSKPSRLVREPQYSHKVQTI